MNKQDFNMLVAEFLGFERLVNQDKYFFDPENSEGGYFLFNPYDDANDLSLLEEKLKIKTEHYLCAWHSTITRPARQYYGKGDSPHESRRACAEEYLKEWKK